MNKKIIMGKCTLDVFYECGERIRILIINPELCSDERFEEICICEFCRESCLYFKPLTLEIK